MRHLNYIYVLMDTMMAMRLFDIKSVAFEMRVRVRVMMMMIFTWKFHT